MTAFLDRLHKTRKGLWHLRKGGMAQYKAFLAHSGSGVFGSRQIDVSAVLATSLRRKHRTLRFRGTTWDGRAPRRQDITVAAILDEFSLVSFQFEWNLVLLSRANWKEELRAHQVDFVFVESAWAGNSGDWQYQLAGTGGPKPEFLELTDFCSRERIPTVFWNKEDPAHYDDFLEAARRFDVVCTTDSNRVSSYRNDLGHERVHVLPFAAQPAVHNPVRPAKGWRSRTIAFAGMYFANKFPERREQLDALLGGAIDATASRPTGLEIFSRVLNRSEYEFPDKFKPYVVGTLSYPEMLTAYKSYKIFLNANSVTDSPSMCARRIFEITASGTSVISAPSAATESYFSSEEVATAKTREETAQLTRVLLANPTLADRMIHRAQRKIWSEHTYSHRAERVVRAVKPALSRPVETPTVSILLSTIRPHLLERFLTTVSRQQDVILEVVLLTHGFELSGPELRRMTESSGLENVVALSAGRDVSLGACLNKCVEAAGGQVLTKMDDDDFYAPHYLSDQTHALMYSGAQVVGKQAHYMFLKDRNATVLRYPDKEHMFTRMVSGPTLMAFRDVFLDNPFIDVSIGEDTEFLKTVHRHGGAIYSSDRFNYCQYRGSMDHTWDIGSHEILESSAIEIFGSPLEHITL